MSGSSGRRTRRCTRRGAELTILHDDPSFINVRLAGDRRCSADCGGSVARLASVLSHRLVQAFVFVAALCPTPWGAAQSLDGCMGTPVRVNDSETVSGRIY